MDVHVHGNPRLHYKLNGCQQTKDDDLKFLSVEEKECILFFEETIDSLGEGFDDTTGLTSRRTAPPERLRTPSNPALRPVLASNISPSLMEHDIIDLVHSPTNFTVPDFQNLAVTPESHYETIPENESVVPSLTTSSDAHDGNHHAPPPGSIPTPVVIASKISEHQGTGGITPSTLLGRRCSLESKRDRPLPARGPNLPSNISMTRGTQEPSPQSLATAAVNFQERRSQMLSNLPAGSHPLEGGEPACMRNLPLRSVSFKDMEPEKSRMEALSKLGLVGCKTPNSSASFVSKGSSSTTSPNNSAYKVSSTGSSPVNSLNKVSSTGSSPVNSLNKVSSTGSSSVNSLNKVSSTGSSPVNSLNKVSSTGSSPVNSLNKVSSTGSSPVNSLNKVSSTGSSPVNSLNKVSSTGSSPVNSLNKVSSTGSSPVNSLNKVSSTGSSPVNSLNKVSSTGSSPVNSLNKVSVSSHAHMSSNINTSSNTGQKKNSNTALAPSTSSSGGYEPKPKAEVSSSNFNYYGGKSATIVPTTKDPAATVNQERRSSIPPVSAEVKHTDFNSYGGKSVILNPTRSVKGGSAPATLANTPEPAETHLNSYGGKSRQISPLVNADVPNGVNCTHSLSPTNTLPPSTYHGDATSYRNPAGQNTDDPKPKALSPSKSDPVNQPIVRTRPATLPPPTAPRPQGHARSLRPRPDPVPSEILSKPAPSFRNQGVTVQFSGKGTTGEDRRDALRRLGLLRKTS